MKILVTGAQGQLGSAVCQVLYRRGIPYFAATRENFDLTDTAMLQAVLQQEQPTAILHCGAYTKVDLAERERELCFLVNRDGTAFLADYCQESDLPMLYVSTDYVFSGEGTEPFETDSPIAPLNVYGESKAAGEQAVRSVVSKHFIVRTSWVFGGEGTHFVRTMQRLAKTHAVLRVVEDQFGSPTYVGDLAPLLCDMLCGQHYGTYHATNEGTCSWAEFARSILKASELASTVEGISTADYPTTAKRPRNSRLSKTSLDAAGFLRLPGWQDALRRYLHTQKREEPRE